MTEWRLYGREEPRYSQVEFFKEHPWVPPENQAGHTERIRMVADLVRKVVAEHGPTTISDLGCGDGSLLYALRDLLVRMWGYDAGRENVRVAREKGLDVGERNILRDRLEYGSLVTCCEVVEHLAQPREFLRCLPSGVEMLIISSPSAETGDWHYGEHAWAWDLDGYAALVRDAGWRVVEHVECAGGVNHHGGVAGEQRFQAIFAERA